MRKTTTTLAGIAGALAIGCAGANLAHADNGTTEFLSDARVAGFANTLGDGGLLTQGFWVCRQIDHGHPVLDIAARYQLINDVSQSQAGKFVGLAIRDLCPWHVPEALRALNPQQGQGTQVNYIAG
jgi:hypothetical protein